MEAKWQTRRTFLVGMAFLSICAFWQMYNSVIPLILTNTFHLNETFSGIIMAADNVLALFLLPFFGVVSDRCKWKMGRRRPFVLIGTLLAVGLMMLLPLLDDAYFNAPATWRLVCFILALGALLIAMGSYRSPAVALMPDVTPKPMRSRANAIINLMGAVGGIIYLLVATVLYSSVRTAGKEHVSYVLLFAIVAGIMLLALFVLMTMVDEPAWAEEVREYEKAHPEENLAEEVVGGGEKLPAAVKRSLGFLLVSIALWFMGYNAVETWFTTYASKIWDASLGDASLCLTIATLGAIVTYYPTGIMAERLGRKKTIRIGLVILGADFATVAFLGFSMHSFSPFLYIFFALVGVAWAMINVNSLPMVVEMCRAEDIGKFTGYYYTFSMAAQTVTPIVAGGMLSRIGYGTLFPYSAIMVALALCTMAFVKHGDSKVIAKRGLEVFEDMD